MLNVIIYIDLGKVFDERELKNILGFNFWGIIVIVFCDEYLIKYYYCIEFDLMF